MARPDRITAEMPGATLHLGDCLDILPTIPDASVDAVISDPPYPCIKRPYGCMTEAEWMAMMQAVVREARRILKPTGSAVFILQPNSRKVGSMRAWLFDFQSWCCREWNMVQDAYWWNTKTLPTAGAPDKGLMRHSIKPCVWLGPSDCYRDQDAVLWGESEENRANRVACRFDKTLSPSGARVGSGEKIQNHRTLHLAASRRGGVTPYNLIPVAGSGAAGHHGATPEPLADWWTRYISPPGGVIADFFMGSGTMGLAALKRGRSFLGIERMPEYFDIAARRLQAERVA